MEQLEHYTSSFSRKRFPIVLILDSISSPANVGSLFRLADAFGVERIISCGKQVNLDSPRLKKTARSTSEKVIFEQHTDCLDVCRDYLKKDYSLLALEITSASKPLHKLEFSQYQKIALVLGHESVGVRQEVLNLCEKHVHVQMFGENSSMNVAQATAIALYEIAKTLSPIN